MQEPLKRGGKLRAGRKGDEFSHSTPTFIDFFFILVKLCLCLSLLVSSLVVESEPQCLRQLCKPQRDKGEETQHMQHMQHVRSVLTRKHKSCLFTVNRNSRVGTVMNL